MGTVTKAGLDAAKSIPKKLVHKKTVEAGEFIGKKSLKKLWKQKLSLIRIQEMLKK